MTQLVRHQDFNVVAEEMKKFAITSDDCTGAMLIELNEIKLAEEAGLDNQVEAHRLKFMELFVERKFKDIGAWPVKTSSPYDSDNEMQISATCNFGHKHTLELKTGIPIKEYKETIPMEKIEAVKKVINTGVFDEINVHDVDDNPDPVVLGKVTGTNAYFVLGQWE